MSTLATITSSFPLLPVVSKDKRTAVLKHIAHSERLVAVRPASCLEVSPKPEMLSTGISELDALTGGIPRGCLTEICGASSSGKTSVLLAAIAAATRQEESCVLIDASDSFDPTSAEAAGCDFKKLLWVRCGNLSAAKEPSPIVGRRRPLANPKNPSANKTNERPFLTAIQQMQPVEEFEDEALADDQRPTTDDYKRWRKNHERRLEQVLKSTDLILQSGGFGLVALDLAGIPDKFVRRIPLASWFRFQRAIEHTKTALLVVSEFPCAQTCAALVMKAQSQPSTFSHQPSGKPAHAQVLEGMNIEAEIMRSRLKRKPMQSIRTAFMTQTMRAG